ncbi:DUF1127 domain-containing protein [Amaricoccus sp.]|uniref:DUF1127 domain-containing protein n=1 Tax=Amaricoccus sp. TaxID=1872485 RepID=UPI0026356C9B|nr:DUF1127 domain-containing protein [uncultured Amaricoccus sp.]
MSIYETNHVVPLGSITTLRVVNAFERMTNLYRSWRDARVTGAQLRKLSDLQLADIGLTRGEIEDLAESFVRR